MSELKPCEKAVEVTRKLMNLIVEEQMTLSEVADVPAELTRQINKNISRLEGETIFTFLQ